MRRIFAPLISKYSVSRTIEIPTTLTVMTSRTASFSEFQTKEGIEPARKKRMTAQGSVLPAASFAVKTEVSVLIQGMTMNPRKR